MSLRRSIIASSLLAAVACAGAQSKTAAADEAPQRAQSRDAVRVLLVAHRETTVSSSVTARIRKLNVSLGLPFAAGQPLVEFDCEEPQARLLMAKAEFAGAQETQEARVRMQGLAQASDVEVALAAAAVSKARSQVDLHQAQVSQCTITAPWSGRVAKVHVRSFMSATPGQPLVDIVANGPLRLKLNLPSKWVGQVNRKTLFNVTIDETRKTYEARVHAINSRVDPVSQTVELEAVITKSFAELLPGMSGTADLSSLR